VLSKLVILQMFLYIGERINNIKEIHSHIWQNRILIQEEK